MATAVDTVEQRHVNPDEFIKAKRKLQQEYDWVFREQDLCSTSVSIHFNIFSEGEHVCSVPMLGTDICHC